MNKPKLIVVILFLIILCVSIPSIYSATNNKQSVIIADFNKGDMLTNLNSEIGTWEVDPEDEKQGVAAATSKDALRGKSGYSLKIDYSVDSPRNAMNGFWMRLPDFDASGFDHFEFRVKGDSLKGHTAILKVEFKKTQADAEGHQETIKGSFVVKGIDGEWRKISIPLNVMNGILDWKDLTELVITFEKKRVDKLSGTLYFDDFAFVRTGVPGPSVKDIVRHKKQKTPAALGSAEFAGFLKSRLNGFPSKVFLQKKFPADDKALLREIAKDTWGYFDKLVDREYQLPIDNVEFTSKGVLTAGTRVGDYTNITNVGLYLMCLVAGYDLGFITKEEAARRLGLTLDSIEQLETYRNFHYNYYDITIFQRTSNFISFVDSGWLAAGLVVAKNAFPEALGPRCQKLLDGMDFAFFYDAVEGYMYHGFYTNIDYYSEYHYGVLYTEPRAISYLAIGKGDVPEEHWFKLERTFSGSWSWQTQSPNGRREKSYLGYTTEGGYYLYDDMKFIPSWGGSMFEALMPTIIMDERSLAPRALGANDELHAKIQIDYALNKSGYPVFGMSPSCVPEGGYSEYGVRPLGMKGYKGGVVTPHATFLALEFTPKECLKNIRQLLKLYDAYGEYGFYDSIDVKTGKVALKYLCLDQAMSLLAIDNYLNDGAIRKRFASDPINKRAEKLLKVEDFFE